jgi:methylglutaconyl-CoA hydratase
METIQIESRGEVTTVRLHRPEVRNALNEVMIAELTHAFCSLTAETRVVILAAAGASFCAGADAQWMKRSKSFSRDENEREP